MSSTWTRARFVATTLAARASGALGTPAVTAALAALLVLYQGTAALWALRGTKEGAEALATSWAFWALYAGIIGDGLARAYRSAPAAFPRSFAARTAPERGRGRLQGLTDFVLGVAWILVGVGFAASLAARDRFTLWAAEGEMFEGAPGQYLTRDPPRSMSPGPKPLRFEVVRVDPRLDGDAAGSPQVTIDLGGRRVTTTRWRPVWVGGARFLRASGHSIAPRYEVLDGEGRVLDSAFVKLAILPPGEIDHVRSEAFPHRLYVRLPEGALSEDRDGALRDLTLHVDVVRGKLPVASGLLRRADELRFEGLVLRVPEARYVAELEIVDDPGAIVLLVAAALGVVGAGGLALLRPRRGGRRTPTA